MLSTETHRRRPEPPLRGVRAVRFFSTLTNAMSDSPRRTRCGLSVTFDVFAILREVEVNCHEARSRRDPDVGRVARCLR
jgi:hypothetical protein